MLCIQLTPFPCHSLADLCNFGGVDYESGSESEGCLPGRRSASLSSDTSAFSCVSVMPTEELDRLLADVRSLDEVSLQVAAQGWEGGAGSEASEMLRDITDDAIHIAVSPGFITTLQI